MIECINSDSRHTLCDDRSSAEAATAQPALMGCSGISPVVFWEYLFPVWYVVSYRSWATSIVDEGVLPFATRYIINVYILEESYGCFLKEIS